MKGYMNDSDARCPFFRNHTSMTIGCESPIDGSYIRLTFREKEDKDVQYKAFCCGKDECCEIWRMVMAKYEGEGAEDE